MSPWTYYPIAMEFARRGWAAAVVMRRGYGGSGGSFAERAGGCEQPDYVRASQTSTQDIRAAIAYGAEMARERFVNVPMERTA